MNKSFPDTLSLSDAGLINGSRWYKLEADFRFYSSKGLITAPKGFLTDGYSVPRILWNWVNPFANGMESSIIHDVNYSKSAPLELTRKEADDLFLEGMKVCGVGFIKRRMIYRAVRMFGGMAWKKR